MIDMLKSKEKEETLLINDFLEVEKNYEVIETRERYLKLEKTTLCSKDEKGQIQGRFITIEEGPNTVGKYLVDAVKLETYVDGKK
jgi:hypothetical protein